MEGIDFFEIAGYGGTLLFLLLSGYFAVKWRQVVGLFKELGEAFTITAEALEDKKLTKQEAIKLLKEWLDVAEQIFKLKAVK